MAANEILRRPGIFFKMFRDRDSLRRRAAVGAFWSVIELGAGQALRLASNLIMTRLLVPEAFGLMAMVTTLQVGLSLLTDISIHRSVVQSKIGDTDLFLRVAWVVQILRGISIAGLTIVGALVLWVLGPILAPPSSIYADPALPGLIALSSVGLILKGFESTSQLLAARRLQYGRLAVLNLSTQAFALVSMVLLGLIEATVWALLVGSLLGGVLRLVLSHWIFDGPRMKLAWDKDIASELWHFGRWLVLSSAIFFVASYADRIIFAALLDAKTFSYYTIASLWVEAVLMLVSLLIDRIGFPSLAETYRTHRDRLVIVYRRFSALVDLSVIVLFLGAVFALPYILHVLYSADYAKSAAYIPFLSLAILCTRYILISMLALSIGDSKTTMWTSVATALFVFTALPIAYNLLGLSGALMVIALRTLAAAPLLLFVRSRILGRGVGVDLIWLFSIVCLAAYLHATYEL